MKYYVLIGGQKRFCHTKREANKDFENLGFVFSDRAHVQCHDEINIGKSWTRHIVQCGLKQYNQ